MKEMKPQELHNDVFTMIGKEWMLVTAGDTQEVNTMTASWGGLGILWNKPVAFVFIRPQRHTKAFIERHDTFSLSFYDENYRKTLSYFGSVSGKDEDKIQKAGFHIAFHDETPYFEEANTVLVCRKLYQQDMAANCFIEKELIDKNYAAQDFHTMYVVEIEHALMK